jgi:hypothetical protein
VYVAAYLPTTNSSSAVATGVRLWMVFILWLAVGFDQYGVGSEPYIYIALSCGLWAGAGNFHYTVPPDVWGHKC